MPVHGQNEPGDTVPISGCAVVAADSQQVSVWSCAADRSLPSTAIFMMEITFTVSRAPKCLIDLYLDKILGLPVQKPFFFFYLE